jgi:hypothetical protein
MEVWRAQGDGGAAGSPGACRVEGQGCLDGLEEGEAFKASKAFKELNAWTQVDATREDPPVLGMCPGTSPVLGTHLFDLLRDVGHCEAVESRHAWEHIGQYAPVQLESDLPNYAAVLLSAGKALDLCAVGRAGTDPGQPSVLPSDSPRVNSNLKENSNTQS